MKNNALKKIYPVTPEFWELVKQYSATHTCAETMCYVKSLTGRKVSESTVRKIRNTQSYAHFVEKNKAYYERYKKNVANDTTMQMDLGIGSTQFEERKDLATHIIGALDRIKMEIRFLEELIKEDKTNDSQKNRDR